LEDFLKENFLFLETRNSAQKVPRKSEKVCAAIQSAKKNPINLDTFC